MRLTPKADNAKFLTESVRCCLHIGLFISHCNVSHVFDVILTYQPTPLTKHASPFFLQSLRLFLCWRPHLFVLSSPHTILSNHQHRLSVVVISWASSRCFGSHTLHTFAHVLCYVMLLLSTLKYPLKCFPRSLFRTSLKQKMSHTFIYGHPVQLRKKWLSNTLFKCKYIIVQSADYW